MQAPLSRRYTMILQAIISLLSLIFSHEVIPQFILCWFSCWSIHYLKLSIKDFIDDVSDKEAQTSFCNYIPCTKTELIELFGIKQVFKTAIERKQVTYWINAEFGKFV